jgi:lysophospholipase L1-like esterase
MAERRDDSLMNRFDDAGLRRFRAREGVIAVLVAAALLVIFQGPSILKAGDQMRDGVGRDLLLGVGRPSNWIARKLPFVEIASTGTSWLHPEADLSGPGGFKNAANLLSTQVPPVTSAAFGPSELGQALPPKTALHKLLVTGDSMSEPMDGDLAETLVTENVNVIRDPHIGSGISTTFVVDWGKLAADQVSKYHPDAVVVFIGANDGFPMQGVSGSEVACCGAEWAAIYANRVRQIVSTYRQGGRSRVYWITLPAPRDPERQHIARVVNAAVRVAVQPWASDVELVDSVPVFTPGFLYRDAMPVAGKQTLVREADGVHLNEAGSSLLARMITEELTRSYTLHR